MRLGNFMLICLFWMNRDDNACWRCEIHFTFLRIEEVDADIWIFRLDTAGTEQFSKFFSFFVSHIT